MDDYSLGEEQTDAAIAFSDRVLEKLKKSGITLNAAIKAVRQDDAGISYAGVSGLTAHESQTGDTSAGLRVVADILDEAGGAITAEEAMRRLNLHDPAQLKALQDDGRILSIFFKGMALYPTFQFDGGRVRPCVAELIKRLSDKGERSVLDYLIWPVRALGGKRPVELIASGDAEQILKVTSWARDLEKAAWCKEVKQRFCAPPV